MAMDSVITSPEFPSRTYYNGLIPAEANPSMRITTKLLPVMALAATLSAAAAQDRWPPGATPAAPQSIQAPAAGVAGPLSGEWAVVQMDGKPTGGYGMTFNFVGSRWEQVFQGTAVSGRFTVSGSTVRMVGDDGVEFGTFQFAVQGTQLTLKGVGKAAGTSFVCQRARA